MSRRASSPPSFLPFPGTACERQLASGAPFVWLARQVSPEKAAGTGSPEPPGHSHQEGGAPHLSERGVGGRRRRLHRHRRAGSGRVGVPITTTPWRRSRFRTSRIRDARGRNRQVRPGCAHGGGRAERTFTWRWTHGFSTSPKRSLPGRRRPSAPAAARSSSWTPTRAASSRSPPYPFVNPNDYRNREQRSWARNRAVTDPVEPGSTFKVVAAAAALEENTVGLDEVFFCENGWTMRNNRVLRDHKPFGYLTFTEAFENSSNICVAKINERITSPRFYDYIRRFGFGEKSMIDLPGEHPGSIRHPRDWSPLSHDSLSIGQEIAVTPVQMVAAFSVIANGGWLLRPRLVDRMDRGGVVQAFRPERRRRVLSQETASRLTAILGRCRRARYGCAGRPGRLSGGRQVRYGAEGPKTAATVGARLLRHSSATRRPRRRAS